MSERGNRLIDALRPVRRTAPTLALILLSSCTTSNTFGTETRAVWCEALLETAATASVHDTPETQESVAANGETIDSLCEDHLTQ